MTLRLRIVSEHRRTLGKRASAVFGVGGGNIGRSADNDWVLPDPSRYVSGRHARIKFNEGRFFIEDTSTNGTYLNDSEQPLPKAMPQPLSNGDLIRLGEYHVVVSLENAADTTQGRQAMVELDTTADSSASLSGQYGDSLDVLSNSSLFGNDEVKPASPVRANQAFGPSALLESSDAVAFDAPPPDAGTVEDSDIVAARRLERLARAVREREKSPEPAPDARGGFDAFCRGAGIDPARLADDNVVAMMQVAGRLLHEALIGLKSLDAKQSDFRRQFRLPPVRDEETQPFQLNSTSGELLQLLLTSHESRRRDAGQWLRACFEQETAHQEALAAAARTGFTEFLAQLAPGELERRFAGTPKRGAADGSKPAIWELYAEFYRIASEVHPDTGVPALYAEALANAYTAAQKKSDD